MDNTVYVADGDSQRDTATLLLAAAVELDLDASVVQRYTGQHSGWQVPEEVAKKAGLDTFDPYEGLTAEVEAARKAAGTLESDGRIFPAHARDTDGSGIPVAKPDAEAAQAAVGGIETGPTNDDAIGGDELAAAVAADDPAATAQASKTPAKKATAKKATAKKTTTAKKTAAKKTTAKKTAAKKTAAAAETAAESKSAPEAGTENS